MTSRPAVSGRLHRLAVPVILDLPRTLLEFAKEVFLPRPSVGEQSGGGVALTIRGASLEPASPIGRVVAVGTIFQPLRIVTPTKGPARVLDVPFTYLRVEALNGSTTRCGIVSALRDPLTKRIATKNTLMALGLKPGRTPTRFRFVTRPDKAPAAGYVLTARDLPDGPPIEVGTTDREGRITLAPGFADNLVVFRLLAGQIEPMVEFPAMPGETDVERTIPFEPRPQTITLEAQLDSLRDAIIDLVAVRARLEARLKARADGEDWAGIEETLKEFQRLPGRETFANRLTQLKDDAALQQARTKSAILTKTAQAQLTDVQALVDRYLDDELFRAYADALDKAKAPPPPKKGARPAAKSGTRAEERGRSESQTSLFTSHFAALASASSLALGAPIAKSLASLAPPRNSRWRAGVESRSIWLYQVVTIRVNSSIFSSCSRVYCSDGSPDFASRTQCSSSAIVGSISRRLRSAMMTRKVSITSFSASNRSRRSPMIWTRRTTPQVISSRRLVETFERLTSRSLLISSASSASGETKSSAWTWAMVRLIPQAWPISPQWSTNFLAAGVSITVSTATSGQTVPTERIF